MGVENEDLALKIKANLLWQNEKKIGAWKKTDCRKEVFSNALKI